MPASKDYVEIPASHTQLNFTSEAFSVILRVYLDTLTGHQQLFIRGNYNVVGWRFVWVSNDALYFTTMQAGVVQQSNGGGAQMSAGAWFTVGFSRSGAAAKIYVNGVDRTTTAATHINPTTSTQTALIGIMEDKVNQPLDGKIEFLRIFGGIALSTSEHLAYHNALA